MTAMIVVTATTGAGAGVLRRTGAKPLIVTDRDARGEEHRRHRLGDGQYLSAGRWLGRHRPAEHDLRQRRRHYASVHSNVAGLATATSTHGYTSAFHCAAGISGLGVLVALRILPSDGAARTRSA
jgi:hypothetical protein